MSFPIYPDKVSIIIPIYNVEPYIEACILSVVNQTHPNLEIILVDDCSTDQSLCKAEQLLKQSPHEWKIVSHAVNRGLSAARNSGTDAATGTFIYYLDSDDYIAVDTIERLVHAIHLHQADVAFGCGYILLHDDGTLSPIWKDTAENLHEIDAFLAYLRQEHPFMAQHRLIRLAAYREKKIRFREGLVHEDILWSLQMSRSGLRICSAPGRHLYFYRQRGSSIMAQPNFSPKRVEGYAVATEAHHQLLTREKLYLNPDFCKMYAYLFHTTINMLISDKQTPHRAQCKAIAAFLQKTPYTIPEIASTQRFLKSYIWLAKFMPARLARKLASIIQFTK